VTPTLAASNGLPSARSLRLRFPIDETVWSHYCSACRMEPAPLQKRPDIGFDADQHAACEPAGEIIGETS